jgi:hypothetical protein
MRVVGLLLPLSMVTGAGACSFQPATERLPGDGADPGAPWLGGYVHRKAITIRAGVSSPLVDFPVGLVETADPQLAAGARMDGHDLVVTAGDGTTVLARELVGFDHVHGALELWVRVPSLGADPTTLYLYYGGPDATPDPAGVWTSSFAGVWHLSDPATRDSTSHHFDLAPKNATKAPAPAPDGIAGGARAYDGTADPLTADQDAFDFGTASFSFSLWLQLPSVPPGYVEPLYHGGTSGGDPGYCVLVGPQAVAKVQAQTSYADPSFGTLPTDAGWMHLAGVVDRASHDLRVYVNGARVDHQDLADVGPISHDVPLALGRSDQDPFVGALDEVRLSSAPRSDAWIAAAYANLGRSGFLTFGPEETR